MEEKDITGGGHRPTERVLRILELLGTEQRRMTMTEICSSLELPKSTAVPILQTMTERGYLELNADTGRYWLGSMMIVLGRRFLDGLNLMEEVQRELDRIVETCSETCHFAVLDGPDVLYLRKKESKEPFRMLSMVGKRVPAYATGLGKALLCGHSREELETLYPDGLKKLTAHTIDSLGGLTEQLDRVRNEGFAYEKEESNEYIQCIAVPICRRGKPQAAISVSVPVFRYTEELEEKIKLRLSKARERLELLAENEEESFKYHL